MHFKLNNKNPYRDLIKNVNIIARSSKSDSERVKNYHALFKLLKDRLKENEQYLHTSPAFADRCEHWNYREMPSISPVTNLRNPWLLFKRQFEKALVAADNSSYSEVATIVSTELAWFYANPYRNDWIVSA